MADSYDIIISAVDSASEAFQSIINTVQEFGSSVSDTVSNAGSEFDSMAENVTGFQDAVANIDQASIEDLAEELGMSAEEFERLIETGANLGSIPFNDAAAAADELETEIDEAADAMDRLGSAGDVKAADTLMGISESVTGLMQNAANTAGNFQDSMTRVSLAAEGAGISVEDMTSAVSSMSNETGRAGSKVRESFIAMTSAGITDMNTMQSVFKGASAQAFLLGTDVNSLADKFSGMAMKSTISEKTLKGTGVTMQELGDAMGMTGATVDEVKAKWKELDTNQRAAALGAAASMNEGKTANDEYKNSWQGLQEQVEIAKGRLERIVGSVILPVLIPAMKIASDILNALGDAINWIMSGPLGGFVSVLGTLAGVFVIAVAGAAGLRSILAFLKLETMLETAATIMNTIAKAANAEGSTLAALANAILGTSFMESAAAAWAAAAGFLAATWPLLVIIGVIALVVVAIYELGKAFGWWTDVSSMIDAIKAGVTELWEAFINHPDVQAAIEVITNAWEALTSAIGWAWNAVLEFLGLANGGEFDVLHAVINGIGAAWDMVKAALEPVITAVMGVINAFNQFRTGQIDLPTFIWNVLSTLANMYITISNRIISLVIQFGSKMVSQGISAAASFVRNIVNKISQLPGQVGNKIHAVISHIVSGMQAWISSGLSKAGEFVSQIPSRFSELPGKISSALNGVISAITQPFKSAYDSVVGVVDNIKNKVTEGLNELGKLTGFGGETAYGGETATDIATGEIFNTNSGEVIIDESSIDVNITEEIILSLKDVPAHIDTQTLIKMLQDKEVLRALTANKDFQDLDAKIKQEILSKVNRAKGV